MNIFIGFNIHIASRVKIENHFASNQKPLFNIYFFYKSLQAMHVNGLTYGNLENRRTIHISHFLVRYRKYNKFILSIYSANRHSVDLVLTYHAKFIAIIFRVNVWAPVCICVRYAKKIYTEESKCGSEWMNERINKKHCPHKSENLWIKCKRLNEIVISYKKKWYFFFDVVVVVMLLHLVYSTISTDEWPCYYIFCTWIAYKLNIYSQLVAMRSIKVPDDNKMKWFLVNILYHHHFKISI